MKLWDKGQTIDQKIEQFTVGNDRDLDMHIAPYDLKASKAHAKMLNKVGLLTKDELTDLLRGLTILQEQYDGGEFIIEEQFEDVHSKIEYELIKQLGEVGKKIHTARSRNDQVLVALQLYYKDQLQTIYTKIESLFTCLLDLAQTHQDKLVPGYTHLQVAMPSSFGLWFSSYAELLIDDVYLLQAAQKVVDQNPLGSAAGYGSSFPIDREFTTKELDFATLKYNVVAAQMGRGKNERTIAMALAGLAGTLSKFAMDICLYLSQNFDFISFPESLTTGSSIMPHKKNPDVFELLRARCNKIQSLSNEMTLITNNMPSGYHRDFQLLKENMINGLLDMNTVLDIFTYSIQQVIVKEIDLNDKKYQYLFTVDSINSLVEAGSSFREAYREIAEAIQDKKYTQESNRRHSHLGSMHNLGLPQIQAKFPK